MKTLTALPIFFFFLFLSLSIAKAQCVEPYENLEITNDTTFCRGTYYLNDTEGDGSIRIANSGIKIYCNETVFIGNYTTNSIGILVKEVFSIILTKTTDASFGCKVLKYTYGIKIDTNNGNKFSDIILNDNTFGIHIYNSLNNILSNITASSNFYGILIRYDSSNNTLSNTTLNSNNYGIYLDTGGTGNTFSNTKITSSLYYGVYLREGGNIFYNNLFNNTENFKFEIIYQNYWNTSYQSGTNIWNSSLGYIGGNLWTNPNGNEYSDTCWDTNADGFCDDPYTLAENNTDYLPIAKTVGQVAPTCIEPYEGMVIDSDTTFCRGTYYLNFTPIRFSNPNIKVYCNETVFIGNNTPDSTAIMVDRDNVTITKTDDASFGCKFSNYRFGTSVEPVANSVIEYVDIENIQENGEAGIMVNGGTNFTIRHIRGYDSKETVDVRGYNNYGTVDDVFCHNMTAWGCVVTGFNPPQNLTLNLGNVTCEDSDTCVNIVWAEDLKLNCFGTIDSSNYKGIKIFQSLANTEIENCSVTNSTDGIFIEDSNYTTIKNLKSYSNNEGISFSGSNNILKDSEFWNISSMAILLDGTGSNNTVENVVVRDSQGIGIWVDWSRIGDTIDNATIYNLPNNFPIYITSDNHTVKNSVIYNSINGIGIHSEGDYDTLENIEVFNTSGYGISIDGSNHILRNLTVHSTQGISVLGSNHLLEDIETFDTIPDWAGVWINSQNTILRNIYSHDEYRSILNGINNTIEYSRCENVTYGCWHVFANNTIIRHNDFPNVISLFGSSYGKIYNNTIGDGIGIQDWNGVSSSYNEIYNNYIFRETPCGIYLTNSSDNIIYNNIINSSTAVCFGENIYSNYWNTSYQSGTNIWNSSLGYIGGNLWTNPTNNGYSDTCTDADYNGFCDNSYTLTTDNIDYLPIARSVGQYLVYVYNVSSCSVLDQENATYYLTQDIIDQNVSACISINANGITLDCQNHLIDGVDFYVPQPNEQMSFGIILNGNNNIIIRNCKLSDWSHPLNLLNGENISVENVEAFSGVWIGPFVANSNNVYLSNITVHDFAQDGFTFRTNNSRLENATIYNVGHIGISIDTNSNNISLENIEVFNTSDIGISIDGSNHVLRNLTVHDTGHYGVILNGNSNYVNNTKIYYVNAEYPNEGGIVISCNDCLIENSEIFNTTAIEKNGRGIFSQHSNNLTIRNSKIYNIGWEACTSLEEADNITLDNVEAWNCWSLRFSYATNSRIINSRTQWVVVDSSSSNILISNNTLEDGIGMDSSSNILISNNTIKGSLGMAMGNSDKITITNNTFENDVLSYYYNIVSDVLSCNNTATFNRSYDFEDGTVLLNVMRTESDSCTPYISYTAPTQISFGSVIPYNTYVNDTEETTISSNMVNMTFSLNGTSDFVSNGYNFSISYLNFSADKNFPYPVEETTVELNTIKNTFLFLVNQTNSIIYNLWRLKVPKTYAGDYTANVTLMVST